MSTDYTPLKKISARDLFDGRLERFGVREHVKPDGTTDRRRCLTDGRNYMWVYIDEYGFICGLTRYAGNAAGKILDAVADSFNTEIISEYDEPYLEFHNELLKWLNEEPSDIRPGTIWMRTAEIVKALVEKDPSLLLPESKDKLRNEIESIWERDDDVFFAQLGGPSTKQVTSV
jgi:hypothetical protein